MTPAALRAARHELGLTQARLAVALGLDGRNAARTVRKWEAGRHPIGGPVAVAVGLLLERQGRP